jgi:hypothetical protein
MWEESSQQEVQVPFVLYFRLGIEVMVLRDDSQLD